MIKKILASLLLTISFCLIADAGDGSYSTTGTFTGEITAIEESRDSITVVADDGQVRMFAASHSRKNNLSVGDKIRVGYVNQYEWPLPVRSLTVLRGVYGK